MAQTIKVPQLQSRWASMPSWLIRRPGDYNSVFPDMRWEMHVWLYGDGLFEPPRGPWIIHREMLLDKVSKNWNEENKETYNGYRWEYQDHLIRARRPTYPGGAASEEMDAIGLVQVPEDRFFCEWDANIKKEDMLITLTKFDFINKPTKNLITIDTEYSIVRVDRVEGDLGRVEYLRCTVKKSNPNPELSILKLV